MDILAHTLWTNLAAREVNRVNRNRRQLRPWVTALWGVIPDFIAFTPVFGWALYQWMFGEFQFGGLPRHDRMDGLTRLPIYQFTYSLYNLSHSLVVFFVIFGLVCFIRRLWYPGRTVPWEMGGWLLHILIDVPTHSYRYFPTPILWPLSQWRFDGISWGEPWFMILNYGSLCVLYIYLYRRSRRQS